TTTRRARAGLALASLFWLAAAPARSQTGFDTWVETCELSNRDLVQLQANEAFLVHHDTIHDNGDGTFSLDSQPYTHTGIQGPLPLCSNSIFYGQPQASGDNFRSAVQVGTDLVLTAWHNAGATLPPVAIVFGLHYHQVGDSCLPPDFG